MSTYVTRRESASSSNLLQTRAGTPEPQVHVAEFWTARQRQMHPLHYAVSYRASFKPELPDFFIRKYLADARGKPVVLDPFGGRGTTIIQANMLGYHGVHNDRSPVSLFLARARQKIPELSHLIERVESLDLDRIHRPLPESTRARLSPFFHARTLNEIVSLREQILAAAPNDAALSYIGLTALSRLHGHSDGFFSVYSFPQISIMPEAQARNNLRRKQKPEYRPIKERIIRKMKTDLSQPLPPEYTVASRNRYLNEDARDLKGLRGSSVDLIVTSPPFLDKVNYVQDNWMRSWFLDCEEEIDDGALTMTPDPDDWCDFMEDVMREMLRVLKPGGHAVIEVGEVLSRRGAAPLNLEELLVARLPLRLRSGRLVPREIFINNQAFTKLANCWSVTNNQKGTNTNRCLVVQKVS